MGGLLTALYEKQTKRGKRMAFGSLEDLEGSFELVVFAEPYEKHRSLLFEAKSQSEGEGGPALLFATHDLDDMVELATRVVVIEGRPASIERTLDPSTVGARQTIGYALAEARR